MLRTCVSFNLSLPIIWQMMVIIPTLPNSDYFPRHSLTLRTTSNAMRSVTSRTISNTNTVSREVFLLMLHHHMKRTYANKNARGTKNQDAREDAWSRIMVLAEDPPNQETREDALTRPVPSTDEAWARVKVLAQARPNKEGREEALSRISRITMLGHRPNTKATNSAVRNNTSRPTQLYTQVTTTAQSSELEQLSYPSPSNGSFYLPREVVIILGTVERKLRGATILEWIEKKLVPVGRSAVYECLSNARKGRPVSTDWNMKGQKPILTLAEIEEVGVSLRIIRGESSYTRKDAEAAFTKKHHDNMDLQGLMPIGKSSVLSATTITNYMAILASSAGTTALG